MISLLYKTIPGRMLLKALSQSSLSKKYAKFIDSKASCLLIKPFIRFNQIDMSEYKKEQYHSFNDFFTRQIKTGKRPVDPSPEKLVAPCDGFLSAYKIRQGLVIPVKEVPYSICDLLRNPRLAKEYEDGYCLVFRLSVGDYHRYIYPDHGRVVETKRLKGILQPVKPVARENTKVFVENTREYAVLDTENFGQMIQMEVGALLVGRINNYKRRGTFAKGQEKGCFMYGGSTVILLLKKDATELPEGLFETSGHGKEEKVKMGQSLT